MGGDPPIYDAGVVGASERYPDLAQFFGGYLHQDWAMEYPDAHAAVGAAIAESSPDRLTECRHQLDELLATVETEEEMQPVVNDLTGWGYSPPGDGWSSYRDWLIEVRTRLG
jgi:hypothetical protein